MRVEVNGSPPVQPTVRAVTLFQDPWRGNIQKDAAILEFENAVSSSWTPMELSHARDKRWRDKRIRNIGFPSFVKCTATTCEPGAGRMAFQAGRIDPPIKPRLVRTLLDAATGQSGGPVFYCPGGADPDECEAGDTGKVVSVLTTRDLQPQSMAGPKVPGHLRDWVLAVL